MVHVIYVRYMIYNDKYIHIYIYEIRDKYSIYDKCEMLYTADSYICIHMIYMIYVVFMYMYEIYVI